MAIRWTKFAVFAVGKLGYESRRFFQRLQPKIKPMLDIMVNAMMSDEGMGTAIMNSPTCSDLLNRLLTGA